MTAPNAELAYRVLDHIDAHPEQWNQVSWCGTAKCFAGWTVELSGERAEELDSVATRAAQLLGFASEREMDEVSYVNQQVDSAGFAKQEYELFSAINEREDLGRLVTEIFGPRPAGGAA